MNPCPPQRFAICLQVAEKLVRLSRGPQILAAIGVGWQDFRKAILSAAIPSVRGSFKLGPNQHPIQDWYSLKAEKGPDGKIALKTEGKILTEHGDIYAANCKMPAE